MPHTLSLLLLITSWLLMMSGVHAEAVSTDQNGVKLNANLEKTDSWPSGPLVLVTHGTLAHNRMEIMAQLQSMLKERGISSLAINLSLGLDDRTSDMYDCKIPHVHKHTDAVTEIGTWVDWLKTQGVTKLAVLGHSRGGNQTARYALNADPAVVQVTLVAPATWSLEKEVVDYHKRYNAEIIPILDRAHQLAAAGKTDQLMDLPGFIYCENAKASAAAVVSYYTPDDDMHSPNLLARIKAPVLVIAGSADTVVEGLIPAIEPIADGEKVALLVIDGADHFFRDLYAEEIADAVAERFDQ